MGTHDTWWVFIFQNEGIRKWKIMFQVLKFSVNNDNNSERLLVYVNDRTKNIEMTACAKFCKLTSSKGCYENLENFWGQFSFLIENIWVYKLSQWKNAFKAMPHSFLQLEILWITQQVIYQPLDLLTIVSQDLLNSFAQQYFMTMKKQWMIKKSCL